MHKLIGSGLVFAVATFACGNALADNCSGNWTNTAMSGDTIDLGDGHTLTTFFSRGSVSSANSPIRVIGCLIVVRPPVPNRALAGMSSNPTTDTWLGTPIS